MNKAIYHLKARNIMVHHWLLRAGRAVDADQFGHVFSDTAPPIGWHLWHMARFADRLGAKLGQLSGAAANEELWQEADCRVKWNLTGSELGVFDSGMGQPHAAAQTTIVAVGQAAILAYAEEVFARCNAVITALSDQDFEKSYFGIMDYGYDGQTGKVWATEPKASVVAQDLVFHAAHGSRHMGMMEALTGLLGSAGTLSI